MNSFCLLDNCYRVSFPHMCMSQEDEEKKEEERLRRSIMANWS